MAAQQRLPDGSIEGADPFNSWTSSSAAFTVYSQQSGSADHGSKYGQATINTTSATDLRSQEIPCSPGDVVSVGGVLRDSSDGSQWAIGLRFILSSGSSNQIPTKTAVASGSWGTRRTHFATAPADTIGVRLVMSGAAGSNGRTIKFDSLLLSIDTTSYVGGFLDFPALTGPNHIVVVVDDGAWRDMRRMPVWDTLTEDGVTLPRYNVPYPSCSPSRAAMLTGLNPSNCGIQDNDASAATWISEGLDAISLGTKVSLAGGRAGIFGKFLHTAIDQPGFVPSGFYRGNITDEGYMGFNYPWRSWVGASVSSGTKGDAESDYHVDWIRDALVAAIPDDVAAGVPFVYIVNPQPPHGNHNEDPITGPTAPEVSAAPRHRVRPVDGSDEDDQWTALGWTKPAEGANEWDEVTIYEDEDDPFNNTPLVNAPAWFPESAMGSGGLANGLAMVKDRIRANQSVSELVEDVIDTLTSEGALADTCIWLVSDNGYHVAEYTLRKGKGTWLEQDIEIPAVVMPPGGTSPRTENMLVTPVDVLPTILDSWGITPPSTLDGRSIWDLLNDDPMTERKHIVQGFRDSQSWDDRIGSGQPPSWDSIMGETSGGVRYQFVSHEPDATTPPPTDKGVLRILGGDGADIMVNRYAELALSSRTAIMAALVATRDATGSARVTLESSALPALVFEEDVETRIRVMIGDLDLTDLATVTGFETPTPPRRDRGIYMPGIDGMIYRGGNRHTEAVYPLAILVPEDRRDTLDLIVRKLDADSYAAQSSSDNMVKITITYPDGSGRECRGYVRGQIQTPWLGPDSARVLCDFVVPDGSMRDLERTVEQVDLDWDDEQTDGVVRFALTGSWPVQGPRLMIHGEIPGPLTITDAQSGVTGFTYLDDLGPTERLYIDAGSYTARLYADDDDGSGTPVRSRIRRISPPANMPGAAVGRWLRIYPSGQNGRYTINVATGGPVSGAWIESDIAGRHRGA